MKFYQYISYEKCHYLVLGGGEVTLLEMTAAYGAFANNGEWYDTTPILAIQNEKGDVLESYDGKPIQVLDREVAISINDILSDNEARTPAFGSDSPLYFRNKDVANKTGTTNDYRDAWVIGYTPSIVVGAWAGNNDNSPMVKSVASYILAPIWHDAMDKAIARFPSPHFIHPPKSLAVLPTPLADPLGTDFLSNAHEILFFAKKDNPQAGAPLDPYEDPQLALWDYPVKLWATEQIASSTIASMITPNISAENGFFGIGGPEGKPIQMFVVAPGNGLNILVSKPFIATIRHSEMEKLTRVSYYLNDTYVGSTDVSPFSLSIMPNVEGEVVLRAVAESPLGNSTAFSTITIGRDSVLTRNNQ